MMSVFRAGSKSTTELSASFALHPEEQQEMIRFLQRLVQTESYSTQEGNAAILVGETLQRLGVSDVSIDQVGNVVARLGSGREPVLLYDGHLDTVLPSRGNWPYPPFEGVIKDGILYGLGASDMKGSLAAMVFAAHRLVKMKAPLNGTLVLAFVVQEEPCEGCALKALVEHTGLRPDFVLLGEPSGMNIMRGQRGRVLFKVTVQGRSAHASSPALGQNAIVAAARLIFGIDLLAVDLTNDPFLGPGSLAVTRIESDSPSLNAIPDVCEFYVDRRLTLGETPTRAQAQIESVIERERIAGSVEIVEYKEQSYKGHEICSREAFNAWALDANHTLIKTLERATRAVLGAAPRIDHWPFSTDGVYSMGELGIPTAGLGPGNPEHAHTTEDQVPLEDVAKAAQIYAMLAAMLL